MTIWGDRDAMLRAKRGDAKERDRLIRDAQPLVDRIALYARRIGMLQQCRISAEDVKQECFLFILTALQRWDEIRDPFPFFARYAYGAMRIYAYRSFPVTISARGYYGHAVECVWSGDKAEQGSDSDRATLFDGISGGDDTEKEAMLQQELREALQGVPDAQQKMLLLIAQGYTYSEVGEICGVSYQTVHNVVMRVAPGFRQKRAGCTRRKKAAV